MSPSSTRSPHANPKGLKVFLIVCGSLCGAIFLALFFHAVYRRYRRAIRTAWFSLRGLDPNAPENRYPAARPTRQSKRFAGVRVVDGNAILTKKDYDRLRAQTPVLIQVDDISAGEMSADFSQVDVMTVTTFSRAGSIASPRFRHREESEGFGWEEGEGTPNAALDPVEVEMLEMKEEIARERNRATLLADAPPQVEQRAQPTTTQVPRLSKGMPSRALSQHTLDPSTGVTIVTAMSRDDLAAFLAMEEAKAPLHTREATRAQIVELLEIPHSPLLSPGVDLTHTSGSWPQEPSEARTPGQDQWNSSSPPYASCAQQAVPTLATDYGQLSDPPTASSVTHSSSSSSEAGGDDLERSRTNSVALAAMSIRSLRSVRFTLPARDNKSKSTGVGMKKHRRREVRREVHRHHVQNGGYIICKDDDEEVRRKLAKKRSSRSEPSTPKHTSKSGKPEKKKRFVFQRRPSEEYYGTAEYLPAQPGERE